MSILKFGFAEIIFALCQNVNMENLKNLRKNRGLYQKDIADLLGVAISTVSAWENDIYEIDFHNLKKLADFFDVTVDELLGRTTEPQLFDDARVERPEILELYESLTPELQEHALAYLHGLADRAAIRNVHSVNVTFEDNRRKRQ